MSISFASDEGSLPAQLESVDAVPAVRLSDVDRAALGYWLAAHVVLFVLAYTAAWVLAPGKAHLPLVSGYQQWDASLLQNIAAHGYFAPASIPHNAAFFPGYPLTLAVVHAVVRNWIAAELLISLFAGAVAVVALARLAGTSRAALFLLTVPTAVFLTVGYSESLYLALAIPAWNAARHGAWNRAGLLAALAAFTRPDGLFLLPALAVMALTRPGSVRRGASALAGVCIGVLGPAVYELYLYANTHRWSAWQDANQAGWALHYVGPLQAWKTSYWGAFDHPFDAEFGFMEQLEIAGLAAITVAAIVFLARRHWPEATYCAVAAAGLGVQTWYQSVPRTLLVMFPIWAALARYTRNRPRATALYFAATAPLAVVTALLYLAGRWAG